MFRRLVSALLLALALGASAARVVTQSADYTVDAKYVKDLLTALENGDRSAARDLMKRDPRGAQSVIGSIEDPVGKAARTAYDVRKQAAEEVIAETVKRAQKDPKTKGKLVSVEVGGTAGKEGPGFTPKTADLDFQFRGTDPDASRAARDMARQVMKDLGVPDQWGINPFAANPDPGPPSATNADLNRNQNERVKTMRDRVPDKEASKGDANDSVRRDYYERGMAYEIDPKTGEIKRNPVTGEPVKKAVEDLYREKGWPPPEVTDASAFGTAANERAKFGTLTEDAKRVFRAADALDLVDRTALSAEDRATVDLSRRLYETRDPQKALQSLPKDSPLRQAFEAAVKQGLTPADAAASVVANENGRARAILDRAVTRTLEAKLADVEYTKAMTDHEVLSEVGYAAGQGDERAMDWLTDYKDKTPAEKAEMLKVAREHMLEQKRLGIVETFSTMDADVKTRILNDPKFSKNELVKNASAFADVISGRSEGLNHAREALNGEVERRSAGATGEGAADPATGSSGKTAGGTTKGAGDDPPGGPAKPHDYNPDLPGGGALRAADSVLLGMAVAGALDDVVTETLKAYDKGGKGAAAIVFFQRVGVKAGEMGVGMAIGYLVEQAGLRIEAAIGIRGITAGLSGAATIQAVVEASRIVGNTVWRAAQDPFLRTYLEPGGAVSFYQVMKTRPQTLYADVVGYAKANKMDPKNLDAVLTRMIKEYSGDSGVKATYTTGMDKRMLDGLKGVMDSSQDFLSTVYLARAKDTLARADANLSRAKATLTDLEKAEATKKAKADAAEAARRARAERREKERRITEAESAARAKADAEKAAAAKAAADRAAEEKAAREQAAQERNETSSSQQSRWNAIRKEADADAQAAADAAAQRRADEEARLRAEEDARRREAEEAALLEDVEIVLGVPASLAPGGEADISVSVRAPKGLRLSGRRVSIRASPGHTDDGSIPLSSSGRGQTVYVAPPDYNGYVRVTANFEGYGQVSRTFLVGNPVQQAPPEQKIENPKPVTLPETPDPVTIVEIAFTTDEGRGSGRFEVVGGKATGRITYDGTTELEGEFLEGYINTRGKQQWSAEFSGASYQTDLIQGSGPFSTTLRYDNGINGAGRGTHSTRLRLQPGGRLEIEITVDVEATMSAGGKSETQRYSNTEKQAGTWTKTSK